MDWLWLAAPPQLLAVRLTVLFPVVAQGHFGLAGMRERATMVGGKLDSQTAVEYGTVVILEIPV
jgi:signal transduction histidine kinase